MKRFEKYTGGGYRLNSFLPRNKKLGKYFTKGLQAGVLATALMLGTAGCGNNAGGSTVEEEYTPTPTPTPTRPGECTGDHFQYEYEELGGVQFVGGNEDWDRTYIDIDETFDNHYDKAMQFMYKKIANLQKDLNKVDTENNPLYKLIGTALKKDPAQDEQYEPTISTVINNNYENLAPIFAHFQKQYLNEQGNSYDNDAKIKYNCFQACYHLLAREAFNKSIGNVSRGTFETNTEYTEHDYFFNAELAKAGLNCTTQTFTTAMAKENMKVTLDEIANKTNTDSAILQKVVELALYNESLYGLHDFAKVEFKARGKEFDRYWQYQRDHSVFDDVIDKEFFNTRNIIDDRTM